VSVGDILVVDAVVHALDNSPEARNDNRFAQAVVDAEWPWQAALMPEEYVLEKERYNRRFPTEGLISALFEESHVDIACYHSVPMYGIFKNYSPIAVGLEMRRRCPSRVFVYGPISPFYGPQAAIAELERQVEEDRIDGIKLYPWDLIDGEFRSFSLADEKNLYPILQRCQELGIKSVGVHKALPLGLAPMEPYRVGDVDHAARDFPDLAFEVVHAGLAFLDESASQLARYPNVWVNLEITAHYAIKYKRKFAEIMGEFLLAGGEDRLLWATGCSFTHPQPVLDAFLDFEMPPELVEGGYPELTTEIKRKILGLNFARLHHLDVEELGRAIAGDAIEIEKRANGLKPPWSGTPPVTAAEAAAMAAGG